MWFTPYERALLRQQALAKWQHSKGLRSQAAAACQRAELLRQRSGAAILRSREVLRRAETVIGEAAILAEGAATASSVELLADRAISRWDPQMLLHQGVALVACGQLGDLLRMEQLVGGSLGSVLGASDAGTALGLAIAMQPDLAIIDARLELADGVDTALALPLYAPRTRALVLTDEVERAAQVRIVSFDAEARHPDDSVLQSWIERAVA